MDLDDRRILEKLAVQYRVNLPKEPKCYTSGIIHHVYDLGDKFVVKIEGEYPETLKHQEEILNRLVSLGAKVPRAFGYGTINGKEYLVMERVDGSNMVYDWMKMSMPERESIIAQLARELKIYHSIKFDNYSIRMASGAEPLVNLQDAINRRL